MATEEKNTEAPQNGAENTNATNASEERSATIAVWAFPAFILIGAGLALASPDTFTPLAAHISTMIAIIMLCMGLTLTLPDFALVIKRPMPIFIGVLAQFVIMPLGAVAVAKLLGLNPMLAVGLLMLGSVPGGTTSNVVSYLAKGDVALSVTMTSVSTILSPIVTPVIMLLLAGEETPVDGKSMAWSLVQTVLLPVIGGLVIRVIFDRIVQFLLPVLPWLSIIAIGGVVFPAVAKSSETLMNVGVTVLVAVIIHNLIGYILGYFAARATGESPRRVPHHRHRGRHAVRWPGLGHVGQVLGSGGRHPRCGRRRVAQHLRRSVRFSHAPLRQELADPYHGIHAYLRL